MGRSQQWADSVILRMMVRHEAGETIESIARSYGVSHRVIRNALGIKVGSGRIDRASSGRDFRKTYVQMDVHLYEWMEGIAKKLNTTQGLVIEMALFAMYEHEIEVSPNPSPPKGHSAFIGPLERFMIKHHLTAIEKEFYHDK